VRDQAPVLRLVPSEQAAAVDVPATLEAVFHQYSRYVAHIGFQLLGRNDQDLDDLVQEVFLVAGTSLKQMRDPGAIKGWLATITIRKARRHLRLNRLRATFGLREDFDYTRIADSAASPEDRLMLARASRALDRIGPDQRMAWILRHVQGEHLDAVAALCDCSLATAKRRIAAAQAHLDKAVGNA
jgi:RNA polymerase sigma-70 factor, ECF subfamily